MKYFILKNKKISWGSYGEILYAGYNSYNNENDNYYVARTAPFLPSIYRDPYEPILFVNDTMKRALEKSGLNGLNFKKAIKGKIVSLPWEKWDQESKEPEIYPSGDMDAEEYILRRRHNQKLADEMGDIWVVLLIKKDVDSINAGDIFIDKNEIIFSEDAYDWFLKLKNDDIYFKDYA